VAIPARDTAHDTTGPRPGESRPYSVQADWWATLWFGLGLAAGLHRLSDNSFLTHLATGRLILQHGVPRSDPYTFTAAGRPWVVQSWGFSWFQAQVESLVGTWGIRFVFGLVAGTLLVAIWRLSRPAETLVGRMTVTALAGVVGLGWWNERPQTVAFLLAALSLVVVLERRPSGWLVPIFGIWVVVHGSWPFGLVIVGCLPLVDRRRGRWWELPGAAALGVALGALVSPSAWDQVAFPVRMLGHREVLAYIVEWRPPAWDDPATWAFAVQVVATAWALWRARRAGWAVLVAGLVAAALMSRRNIPLASVVMVTAMAPAFARLGRTPVGRTPSWSRLLPVRAVLVVVAGIAVFASPHDYDLGPFPTSAVDWMEPRGLVARPGVRVAAPDYAGNYLEWRFGAAANVFVDDRAEVLDAEVIGDYVRGLLDDELDWRVVLDRYRIDVVLWPADQRLGIEIGEDPGWSTVHRSGGWIVACRRAGGPTC
jgi:hypothetical protein